MIRLIATTPIAAGVGFATLYFLLLSALSPELPQSEKIKTAVACSLAAAFFMSVPMIIAEWLGIGKPASWRWLKHRVNYCVAGRVDDDKGTILCTHCRGKTSVFRFEILLPTEVAAGKVFAIYPSREDFWKGGDLAPDLNYIVLFADELAARKAQPGWRASPARAV